MIMLVERKSIVDSLCLGVASPEWGAEQGNIMGLGEPALVIEISNGVVVSDWLTQSHDQPIGYNVISYIV